MLAYTMNSGILASSELQMFQINQNGCCKLNGNMMKNHQEANLENHLTKARYRSKLQLPWNQFGR